MYEDLLALDALASGVFAATKEHHLLAQGTAKPICKGAGI
jgi:hypothetical protein